MRDGCPCRPAELIEQDDAFVQVAGSPLEVASECLGIPEAHEAKRQVRLHTLGSGNPNRFLEHLACAAEVALLDGCPRRVVERSRKSHAVACAPRQLDALVERRSRSLAIARVQARMADEPEAATDPLCVVELPRERDRFFENRDRSRPVGLPRRSATGCDQCFRTAADRDHAVERERPSEPRTRFAVPRTDLPERVEGTGKSDGNLRFLASDDATERSLKFASSGSRRGSQASVCCAQSSGSAASASSRKWCTCRSATSVSSLFASRSPAYSRIVSSIQ